MQEYYIGVYINDSTIEPEFCDYEKIFHLYKFYVNNNIHDELNKNRRKGKFRLFVDDYDVFVEHAHLLKRYPQLEEMFTYLQNDIEFYAVPDELLEQGYIDFNSELKPILKETLDKKAVYRKYIRTEDNKKFVEEMVDL